MSQILECDVVSGSGFVAIDNQDRPRGKSVLSRNVGSTYRHQVRFQNVPLRPERIICDTRDNLGRTDHNEPAIISRRQFDSGHVVHMNRTSDTPEFGVKECIISISRNLPSIVDGLVARNPDFAYIDKRDLNKKLNRIINNLPSEILMSISRDDLESRIEKIMILESMVSAFSDLTPAQKKQLDE